MAGRSAGELWFEMGVRDKVAGAMEKDIALSKQLKGSIDDVLNSYKSLSKKEKKEVDNMVKGADRYLNALTKINEVRNKLKETKARASVLGIDTKELDSAMRKLNGFHGRYTMMANTFGADSARMRSELGAKFTHRITWLNSIISKYNQLINVEQKEGVAATQAQIKANQSLMSSYDKVTRSARQTMSTLSMLRQQAGYYFSFFGAQTLLRNIITIGGQFEYQHVALQNIIGDAEKATAIFSQLKDLAIESPKTFMELTTAAKQLSAYQIPANELFETTKRLSDLSVGLGVDINRLILAYGQVRSAAVLRGQELRQFTEAGIPIVQALADKFTQMNGKLTTTADVFKLISQRAVPFEMVRDILWEMTNEGGRFYDMQAVMADTLYGKWQKLADIWQITLGDIADANSASGKFFKTALDGVIFLARNLQTIVPMLSSFAVGKMFGGKLENALGYLGSVDANIAKAQKLHMIEQRRRLAEGEITAEQYKQNIALSQQRNNYYALLAVSGRLNAIQVSRLVAQGKINNQVLRELVMTNQLSSRLAAVMRLDRMRGGSGGLLSLLAGGGAGALLKSGAGSLLGGLKSLMGGWVGIGLTAVGALMSYNMKINREIEEARQRTENVKTSAIEMANAVNGALGESAKSSDDLGKKVEYLEEQLESAGDQGKRIISEANGIDDLAERFSYLTRAATAYRDVLEHLSTDSGSSNISAAIHAAGFDDEDNSIVGYEKSISNLSKIKGKMADFSSYYQQMVDTMVGKYKELDAALGDKNLFEKVEYLFTNRKYANSADAILRSMGQSGLLALTGEFTQSLRAVEESFNSVGRDAMKSLDSLKAEALENGIDVSNRYSELTDAEKTKLQTIVTKYLEGLTNASEDTKNRIGNWLAQGLHANLELTPIIKSVKLEGYSKDVWEQFGGAMLDPNDPKAAITIGNTKFTRQQVANTFESPTKFESRIKAEYQSAEDNLEALKKSKIASKEALAEAQEIRDEKKAIWDALRTDSINDKKNTGSRGGGTKVDQFAKNMQERVNILKEAYTEYKKWSELMSKDEALAKVKGSGLFDTLFSDKNFKGLDDYRGELERIKKSLNPAKQEQRKVIDSIGRLLFGMDLDKAKEEADAAVDIINSAMDKIAKQWDNYKSLYEKTGNRDFANLAFSNNVLWDEKATAMAEELTKRANLGTIDFTMSEKAAKDFFKYNTTEGKALYGLWKQITDLIKDNYNNALNESADAISSLMTEEEKIAQIEQKIADLKEKEKASDNDPRIIKLRREAADLQQKAFEKSAGYLKFYNSILSMTIKEAEEIGQKIRENLDKNMQKGVISAKEYVRQVKLINEQMGKLRGKQGDFSALMSGGLQGLFQNKYDTAESDFNQSVIDLQNASEMYEKAISNGSRASFEQAQSAMDSAGAMQEGAAAAMEGASGAMSTVAMIDKIVHGINDVVQGIKGTFDEIKEMYDALGHDTQSDSWENWNTFFDGFSKASQNATNAWDSLKNGNAGGVIQGVVGSFTSWITAFAQGHDRKLEHQIQLAQEQINAIDRLSKSLETQLNRTLGGVYAYTQSEKTKTQLAEWSEFAKADRAFWQQFEKTFGRPGRKQRYSNETIEGLDKALASGEYYDEQLALLLKNRDDLKVQLAAEEDKKKSDSEKIADYKQSIEEIGDQIEHFAEDMAKALYDIDIKSWAQELTDAVVDAWVQGEDAAQAWHDKVRELVTDVTKNILAQKVVEGALDNVLQFITDEMAAKAGKLDESSIVQLAQLLEVAGNNAVDGVTSLLDAMKQAGLDLSDTGSGSSSVSQVLSGLTEDEQGLFMAYVNAIRGDVSIIRMHWDELYAAIAAFPAMGAVAQMQLQQLEAIAANTLRNADSAAVIEGFCRRLELGEAQIRVK